MNATQPTTSYVPPPPPPPPVPGLFGTKIPSAVSFAVGILLFLLPFAEVKCNGSSLASNTGLGIATGMAWKSSANNMFGNDTLGGGTAKADNTQKKDPNMYAIIALALGVIGLILSFMDARSAAGSALVAGIVSAGALIGLMLDLKKEVKQPIPDQTGAGGFGDAMNNMKISLEMTPWFYVAVVAFLVAAFFCYKRIQPVKR
jgi:hypothetical protein